MLTPGPDHPIELEPAARRCRARFNGHVFADTDDALVLREARLPPVIYFPRRDVAMEYTGRTDRRTQCPYKGEASYYTLTMDGDVCENVAWSYEDPYEAMSAIAGMIAFDGRVEVYEVTDPRVESRHNHAFVETQAERDEIDEIGEIIRHTDAGDGTSQRAHWPPNVRALGPQLRGLR
jgi:uncharacterized protein (DUF427 family)